MSSNPLQAFARWMEHTRPERLTPRALAAVARRLTRADSAHDDDRWLLQAIADNTPAAIFVRDLEQRFLFVNRRYRDAFTGGTDVVGRRIDEVFPAPQAADFMQADLRHYPPIQDAETGFLSLPRKAA